MVLFMIPASQLTIDSSMSGVFGEDLPQEIQDYQAVTDEFGEQETVLVVVDCSQSDEVAAKNFLHDLREELADNTFFKDVTYAQTMEFAGEKMILYLPKEHLSLILDPDATIETVQGTYNALINAMKDPSYFVSENGNIYLLKMIFTISYNELSAELRTEAFDGLSTSITDVQNNDPRYGDLEVGFTGGLMVYDYEGDKMALEDMYLMTGVTFILILILLFVSFRSISLPLLALIPLLIGIIITAGLIYLLFDVLNMLAALFAVLLLGLGIDFSIHMLTRFTEEMEAHADIPQAFNHTSVNTGKAIALGTFTTATAFGALYFSRTQAMHEMGIILASGLLITMISVFFVLPALVTLRLRLERGKLKEKMRSRRKFSVLKSFGRISSRFALGFIVLLILIGAFFAFKAPEAELSGNLRELMPTGVPAYKQLEKVKAHFEYSEDYFLCVVDSYDELIRATEEFKTVPEVMAVESILDYLPQNQQAKLELFNLAKAAHPEFAEIPWLNLDEMTWKDLPESMWKNWAAENAHGTRFLIRIEPRGNIWDEEYRTELLEQLKDDDSMIVGMAIMAPKMIELIGDDVIRVTFIAVIPIFLIVYVGFRRKNPIYALLALMPVAFGLGGTLAFSEDLGISLNQVSIMLIPLVVGIGIDNGIHILHRYKEEGTGSIPNVVQNTGKAIFLTTATTCLAFSSFTIAEHPGMQAFAQVPVLGLILCLLAALIFLPALISVILEREAKKKP
jgi:predicted RND superfamily exporter protein